MKLAALMIVDRADFPDEVHAELSTLGHEPDRIAIAPIGKTLADYLWLETPAFESAYARLEYPLADGRTLIVPGYEDDEDEPTAILAAPTSVAPLATTLFATREPIGTVDALAALSRMHETVDPDRLVWVWPHSHVPYDWPIYLGGDEDWVAFVPDGYPRGTYYLEEGTSFGRCTVESRAVEGGTIHIGCHA